jgi:hypothetical protein
VFNTPDECFYYKNNVSTLPENLNTYVRDECEGIQNNLP